MSARSSTPDVLLLAPDNFTPPSRTPWGGRRIASVYKRALDLRVEGPVGESWEVSVGPEFPSRLDGSPRTLADAIAQDPDGVVGREASRGGTALLVKLLDAAEPLSVQIHPEDTFAGLAPDESGKPESWYIAHAEPGAGIYLGLAPDATPASMERALKAGEDVSQLLGFIPVRVGDFFVVEAGTAHAIGAGVTLVEPQIVLPGRKGVTYRYWDWNRRYDDQGRASPSGKPRALHVAQALAVTDWSRARGEAFLREVRVSRGVPDPYAPLALEPLCAREGAPLRSKHLEVSRLAGSGGLTLRASDRMRAVTVLEGALTLGGVTVTGGRSAVIAAGAGDLALKAEGVHAVIASVA